MNPRWRTGLGVATIKTMRPPLEQHQPAGQLLGVVACGLFALLFFGTLGMAGCEKRVISRRAYSPRQFPDTGMATVATTSPRHGEVKDDLIGKIWNGLTRPFQEKRFVAGQSLTKGQVKKIKALRMENQGTSTPDLDSTSGK